MPVSAGQPPPYAHPLYARSLSEFGEPQLLPECNGWILRREIPDFSDFDAAGLYPLFMCESWSRLAADVAALGGDLVSLTLVTDPFGTYEPADLAGCFDIIRPFKVHSVVDLSVPFDNVSRHHLYYGRWALRRLTVTVSTEPARFIDEWETLYGHLRARHRLTGVLAFSREVFARQLRVPGMLMLRATQGDETVAANIWALNGNVAYDHLTASSHAGYGLRAAYALKLHAIEYFAEAGVRWLDLGGGAGVDVRADDGLVAFKRGWARTTRTAHLCGRILDRERYEHLSAATGTSAESYFPAYRLGEYS